MMTRLTTAILYLFLAVFTVLVSTVIVVTRVFGDVDGRIWYPATRWWARSVLRIAGAQPVVSKGWKGLDPRYPVVLMPSHQSHLDGLSLIALSDRPFRVVGKRSLFFFPFFGQALLAAGHIPITRDRREKAFASIERAAEMARAGRHVLVFPEGQRSRDGVLGPFKKGGFVLALKAGLPILPIGIAGTYDVLPPGWWVRDSSPVCVVVGDPIETAGVAFEDRDELVARVRARMVALCAEAEAMRLEHRSGGGSSRAG